VKRGRDKGGIDKSGRIEKRMRVKRWIDKKGSVKGGIDKKGRVKVGSRFP
jgi:hypothetical protein